MDKPVKPYLDEGKLWHTGWDIETNYVIDANKQCWKDNAHGGSLYKCNIRVLFGEVEEERKIHRLRKILGLKPIMPEWMTFALRNNWTPPEDFDESIYADRYEKYPDEK